MIRLAPLILAAWLLLPNPPRQPMKSCPKCGSGNEPWRTSCWNCGASL